ncbi:BadF/BadG/BcrA/BcrD ATPase family protein [Microbacterium kribbense]|uniref:BadF/BadG/BcrA/BcrD ATPase family protein n=1 Tax=Microbacterium kribbense TaxID=433645 RepID=A0ABP7G689_9MICO
MVDGGGGRILVAIDGGGEKTDAVALTVDGDVLAQASGPGSNPRVAGAEAAAEVLARLIGETVRAAHVAAPPAKPVGTAVGGTTAIPVHAFVSGLNLPRDVDALRTHLTGALAQLPAGASAAHECTLALDNDMPAMLRAGTDAADAVAVVCGTGINAIGIRAGHASVRFPALGTISGDWGGGWELGQQALWHAARAQDGRGPDTSLRIVIPQAFGVDDVTDVFTALDSGRVAHAELRRLAPAVLAAAAGGDAIAQSLVDRQAEEVVVLATTVLRRLGLDGAAVPVVLGGGLITGGGPRLTDGIRARLAEQAPWARPFVPDVRPVVGAALLTLAAAGGDAASLARVRSDLCRG